MRPNFWVVSGKLTKEPERRVVIDGSDNSADIVSLYLSDDVASKYFGLEIHDNFKTLNEAKEQIGKE